MAHRPASIVYKNVLPWRGSEKLYLNARTADVYFVFESEDEETVKIPAHKSILSANSEVFDAMFYGPAKQEGDIPIGDSTAGAFKEFLQFFYLGTVKLTADNAAEVMNLGKQYMIDDCFMASSNISEQNLTLDNICSGYELAILFDQDELTKFCEQKISENSREVFQSNSFLMCGSNVLRRILQLDTLTCDESIVFDGCVAWARAACIQKGLDETNMQNLRNQLGDLFYEIRFGEMTTENYFLRYHSYENLFSMEEFKDIIGMIASTDYQPPKFNRNGRKMRQKQNKNNSELICDRIDPACLDHKNHSIDGPPSHDFWYYSKRHQTTVFTSNCMLLLKKIHCCELFNERIKDEETVYSASIIPSIMKVIELADDDSYNPRIRPPKVPKFTTIYSDQVILTSKRQTTVDLTTPIVIQPGVKYGVMFEVSFRKCFTLMTFKPKVQMEQGIEIEFHDMKIGTSGRNGGLVKQMIFMKPEN